MKTIFKSVIAMVAAMIGFSSCDSILSNDSMSLEGTWCLTNADERVVEDGTVHYTFLEDEKCLVAAYNALDNSENATRYSVCKWSFVDDMLTIDQEGGFNYRLSRKSKDKILCTSDSHSTEYYLVREKGTNYNAVIGEWVGENGLWHLYFEHGQKCQLEDMHSVNVATYNCFWYPDGASFALVGDDMKAAYQGFLKDGCISIHEFPEGESITFIKFYLE